MQHLLALYTTGRGFDCNLNARARVTTGLHSRTQHLTDTMLLDVPCLTDSGDVEFLRLYSLVLLGLVNPELWIHFHAQGFEVLSS